MEDHELPLVNVVARIRTGTLLDPADKAGLRPIAGDMMRNGGSTTMTPDQLDEFLEATRRVDRHGHGRRFRLGLDERAQSGRPRGDAGVRRRAAQAAVRRGSAVVAMTGTQAGIARQNDDPQGIR